ncbi:MAG: chemotaxis protein CheA [Bacteroidota bacterium]
MDKFTDKFIEEATENIADLEDALLSLENNPEDSDLVERVFRAMHSLKGGGAMFGFQKLSDFTHHLENIYDRVREGKLTINKGLLDLTLQSVDHLKNLLDEGEDLSRNTETTHKNLSVQVLKFLEDNNSDNSPEQTSQSKAFEDKEKTYYIYFEPEERIFDDGTNPLFLLDEMATLGDVKALPCLERVPNLNELDPTNCYTHWEILLATKEDENAIHDVFIFVEDQSKIEIHELADYNLFQNNGFIREIDKQADLNKDMGIDAIRSIVKTLEGGDKQKKSKQQKKTTNANGKDNTISSIRVASEKIDHMMNLVSELVTTQARLSLEAEKQGDGELTTIAENIQKLSRQLRDTAFNIALVPVETMLTRFQRLVRDLSGNLNKKVKFTAEGTDTELDKNIIETLTDPLLHILRNCIDHGIESPEERKKKGKPEEGRILMKAFYSGTSIHIQIHDDGKGIDPEKIRQKAIEREIISSDEELSKKEIFELLFRAGFSTSDNVTDVSGRGVGMDVVKRKLAEIRGDVEIDSEKEVGTTLTVKLPLTLSIIDGLLVKIEENSYIMPLSAVHKIYAANHSDVVDTFNNLIVLDGEQVPFYYLREEFGMPESDSDLEEIVVVEYEGNRIGLVVDTVIGEYQAVLKSLGRMYKRQDIVSGATILGDGTVALVLDTNKMIEQFSGRKNEKQKVAK